MSASPLSHFFQCFLLYSFLLCVQCLANKHILTHDQWASEGCLAVVVKDDCCMYNRAVWVGALVLIQVVISFGCVYQVIYIYNGIFHPVIKVPLLLLCCLLYSRNAASSKLTASLWRLKVSFSITWKSDFFFFFFFDFPAGHIFIL